MRDDVLGQAELGEHGGAVVERLVDELGDDRRFHVDRRRREVALGGGDAALGEFGQVLVDLRLVVGGDLKPKELVAERERAGDGGCDNAADDEVHNGLDVGEDRGDG